LRRHDDNRILIVLVVDVALAADDHRLRELR